mmetsp:Transcript_36315/g.107218  ORF Transcript_36315/g.107218 Transcript_36315/m.107218 type:complete len:196 (+) Transcript_36315:1296-1883(+)|eukprot:282822-Chlamydomonas_euryale.AAC.7
MAACNSRTQQPYATAGATAADSSRPASRPRSSGAAVLNSRTLQPPCCASVPLNSCAQQPCATTAAMPPGGPSWQAGNLEAELARLAQWHTSRPDRQAVNVADQAGSVAGQLARLANTQGNMRVRPPTQSQCGTVCGLHFAIRCRVHTMLRVSTHVEAHVDVCVWEGSLRVCAAEAWKCVWHAVVWGRALTHETVL